MKTCIVCGGALPADDRPWWRRWWTPAGMPVHATWPGATDADLDECWRAFNARLGEPRPGPRPDAKP